MDLKPGIKRAPRLMREEPCEILRYPLIDHESFHKVVRGGRLLVSHAYWCDRAEEQLRRYEEQKPAGVNIMMRPAAWYPGIENNFKQVFIYEDGVDIDAILRLPYDYFDKRCRAVPVDE